MKTQATVDGDLTSEKQRLRWLHGKLPVPCVLYFYSDEHIQYMLMTQIKGMPSFHPSLRSDMPKLMEQLSQGLRMIHSLDATTCPFKCTLQDKIQLVDDRLRTGRVDVVELLIHFNAMSVQNLYDEMIRLLPNTEDLTICHGDYSMPNVLFEDRRISGFIDLGQLGISDRYTDFVTVRDTLNYNGLPEECFTSFLRAYGLAEVDESKLRFYDLLNRFLD